MFQRRGIIALVCFVVSFSILVTSCSDQTETPAPTPTKRPAATLTARVALQDMRFVIEHDGRLVATEELFIQQLEQGLLVTSELRRIGYTNTLERRALLLSPTLDPISYDLEIGTARAHSTWVALRVDDTLSVLNNNLAWYGPMLVDQIRPMAQLMLESAPSALPFAILALRLTGITNTTTSADQLYQVVDVLEDLPTSRPITLTQSSALKGLVIGNTAYEATTSKGAFCTLWLRPTDRSLYSVEFDDYQFSHWLVRTDAALAGVKRVTIRRVSSLPTLTPAQSPEDLRRIPLEFKGSDGGLRQGVLILPDGQGPFPCLVLQGRGGITARWEVDNIAASQGWAVFSYDKRGLGESAGSFERAGLEDMAADALSAAQVLRQRSDLLPDRLVFLGIGEGSDVGAIASASSTGYDGYILIGSSFSPKVPDAATFEIGTALTQLNGWDKSQTLTFTNQSIVRWRDLLFKDQTEMVLAGRRAGLASLKELTVLNPGEYLSRSTVPILTLVGENDLWVSVDQTQALVAQLNNAGKTDIELAIVAGWDGAITGSVANLVAGSADTVIWAWLTNFAP
ncbi:MAG: alpha/beta hydrolase family protein [Anaerolineae bacterium]